MLPFEEMQDHKDQWLEQLGQWVCKPVDAIFIEAIQEECCFIDSQVIAKQAIG